MVVDDDDVSKDGKPLAIRIIDDFRLDIFGQLLHLCAFRMVGDVVGEE